MKNRRATGTTTATATTPRSGVSVRSRLDLSSALQRAHRPTARSARKRGGCGTGRGLCRLPPVRARTRAPRSRSPLTPRDRRVTRPPGVSTNIIILRRRRRPLLRGRLARTLSRSPGTAAKSGARCGRRGAGSRRAPERRRSIRLSFSLSYEREYRQFRYSPLYLFASPSQSPLLLRAFVPRAERDLRGTLMILPQVHLRKPCYDFYFL